MCSLGKTVSASLVLQYHITASTLEKQNFFYSQKKKKNSPRSDQKEIQFQTLFLKKFKPHLQTKVRKANRKA